MRTALVIGGGVIGVSAAHYLALEGFSVSLLERGEIASGCSYGNAGLVVPSHSIPLAAPGVIGKALRWMADPESPFYVKPRLDPDLVRWLWRFRGACTARHLARSVPVLRDLGFASRALYRELAALDGLDFGYREAGVLAVFRTARAYEEAVREAEFLRRHGMSARCLDGAAARALEPALAAGIAGGVLFGDDAHLIPDAFVTGLAEVAAKRGVEIRRSTEVVGFRTAGRHVVAVETTRGDLEADEIVLAGGAWSAALARPLGLRLPIQPAKGYSATFRRPAQGPRIPLLLGEAKVGVNPMGGRLRLAGTLELAGLDLTIDRRRVAAVLRAGRDYLATLGDLDGLEIWRGLRPCTPDGLPIIGRPSRFDNLILATGHAMIGVSLGPVTGKLVAQLAAGQTPLLDLAPLSPDRFA
jgi:D-amino-acid dehydrogenase